MTLAELIAKQAKTTKELARIKRIARMSDPAKQLKAIYAHMMSADY